MGVYRVLFLLNGKQMDVYTDAPSTEIAKALIAVQLEREGFKNFSILSAFRVGAG